MEIIIALLSVFIGLPAILFTFIYKSKKNKSDIEKLKYQKEILELEIEKENRHIKLLEEENKKLDKIINENK
jgi:cell division protein FtsB